MLQTLLNKLFWKPSVRTHVVCVVHKETVYTTIMGRHRSGVYSDTGEMFEAPFDISQIAANIDKAEALGNPVLPRDTPEVINPRLARAIGSKVPNRWAKKGAMTCVLGWTKDDISLAFNLLDPAYPDGIGYKNAAHFPLGTPSAVLAEAILEEWRRRHAAGE